MIRLPLITWCDMETCSFYICTELRINALKSLADTTWWALWLVTTWECLACLVVKGATDNSRLLGSLLYPVPLDVSTLWRQHAGHFRTLLLACKKVSPNTQNWIYSYLKLICFSCDNRAETVAACIDECEIEKLSNWVGFQRGDSVKILC